MIPSLGAPLVEKNYIPGKSKRRGRVFRAKDIRTTRTPTDGSSLFSKRKQIVDIISRHNYIIIGPIFDYYSDILVML